MCDVIPIRDVFMFANASDKIHYSPRLDAASEISDETVRGHGFVHCQLAPSFHHTKSSEPSTRQSLHRHNSTHEHA